MAYSYKKFVKSLKWSFQQGHPTPELGKEIHLFAQVSKIFQTKIYNPGDHMDIQFKVKQEDGLSRISVRGQGDSLGILFLRRSPDELQEEIQAREIPIRFITEILQGEDPSSDPVRASQEPMIGPQTP